MLKDKLDDTMDSQMLQSPTDQDATYRSKAGNTIKAMLQIQQKR